MTAQALATPSSSEWASERIDVFEGFRRQSNNQRAKMLLTEYSAARLQEFPSYGNLSAPTEINTALDYLVDAMWRLWEHAPEYQEALGELRSIGKTALEEDFPLPNEVAIKNARRLLRELFGISRRRYVIYPTPDGEVAIDAPNGKGKSVLVLCDSRGEVLCIANLGWRHRYVRYKDVSMLPNSFVTKSLRKLK